MRYTPPKPGPLKVRTGLPLEENSAGGIVVDYASPQLNVAVIVRINRADKIELCLPKGHLEGLETPAEAARREVFEETGIDGCVVAPLGTVDYWFSVAGKRIHKIVHHFLFRAVGGEMGIENDPNHEAVDAIWVPLRELNKKLSFDNERRVATAARRSALEYAPRYQ